MAHWVHPSEDREGLGLAWVTQSAWGGPGASNHREMHVAWHVSRGYSDLQGLRAGGRKGRGDHSAW